MEDSEEYEAWVIEHDRRKARAQEVAQSMAEPGSVPIPTSREAIEARLRQLEEYRAAMEAYDPAFSLQVESVPLEMEMDALRAALEDTDKRAGDG